MKGLAIGDYVIYRKYKVSPHPTMRAKEVYPSQFGETYSYAVDKYWVVSEVLADARIKVLTRSGKVHYLNPIDPNLRKPGFFESLRLRGRFPQLAEVLGFRHVLFRQDWGSQHDHTEREVFLVYTLMFLFAVASIVWHLIKVHSH